MLCTDDKIRQKVGLFGRVWNFERNILKMKFGNTGIREFPSSGIRVFGIFRTLFSLTNEIVVLI